MTKAQKIANLTRTIEGIRAEIRRGFTDQTYATEQEQERCARGCLVDAEAQRAKLDRRFAR